MSSYITTMFGTAHIPAISKISVPENVSVYVIMCLNYSVIPTRLYDGINNLRALCHTSDSYSGVIPRWRLGLILVQLIWTYGVPNGKNTKIKFLEKQTICWRPCEVYFFQKHLLPNSSYLNKMALRPSASFIAQHAHKRDEAQVQSFYNS
jgi:hypothetical protein